MPTNDSWVTVRDGRLCFDGAHIVAGAGDVVEVRRRETSADLHAIDLTPALKPDGVPLPPGGAGRSLPPAGSRLRCSDDPLRPHARVLEVRGAAAHLPVGVVVVGGVRVDDLLPGAVAADHHSYVVPVAVAAPVVTSELETDYVRVTPASALAKCPDA